MSKSAFNPMADAYSGETVAFEPRVITYPIKFDLSKLADVEVDRDSGEVTLFVRGNAFDLTIPANELQRHLVNSGMAAIDAEVVVDRAFSGVARELAFLVLKQAIK